MKRVLVTGVTGKSGLYFLNELIAHADSLKDYHFKFFIRSTTDVLSGGTVIQLNDILKEIKSLLGTKNRFISVPFGLAFFGAQCINILTHGKKDYRERVQGLIDPRAYSFGQAAIDFGYSPIDFHTGISAEIELYKQAGGIIIKPERRKD